MQTSKNDPTYCKGCRYDFTSNTDPAALPSIICNTCFAGNLRTPTNPEIDRIAQIERFTSQLRKHIIEYTIPQYSNTAGDDQATNFTVEDCVQQLMTYINRRNARVRGPKEALRDWLKVAHYACFIYDKLKLELNEPDVY